MTLLTGAAGSVERAGDGHSLPGGVNQDVVRHNDGRQGVGLVLTGLPGDRRAFQAGEVPGDAGGAGFETLEQRA